jgi:hypothetical protein
MKNLRLLPAALCVILCVPASADLPVPCLADVCVGDELRQLVDRPSWIPVELPAADEYTAKNEQHLSRMLRGDAQVVADVLKYWPHRWFDGQGLKALNALQAVCDDVGVWLRPHAAFLNSEGRRVVVTFEPVATGVDAHQRFRVATLFTRAAGETARALEAEIAARYEGFPRHPTESEPAVRLRADANGVSLKMFAPIVDSIRIADALREQPNCRRATEPAGSASNVPAQAIVR